MLWEVLYAGWTLPATYLLAFAATLLVPRRAWTIAHGASVAGLGATALAVLGPALPVATAPGNVDAIGLVVASLIAFLGWVIVRFSRVYLHGEAGQVRYVAALLGTLAAVATVVLTHHLAVLVAAWAASSAGLHHLLTFYRDRAPAQVVAHKKFLVSRMAELCLLAALVLIYRDAGTLSIDAIAALLAPAVAAPPALQAAALLIALAVILKSAQLPLHGWLIQVMEAPTPVSALLHAGIVNIGGFVLIRLAVLIDAAPGAQLLLVVMGSATAVLAGLVMMTRISIKVRLAWSTCAQMGFMLMECGLGLYALALLHLVAHSLYKAHAFLSAGETVLDLRRRDLTRSSLPEATHPPLAGRLLALPVSVALVVASACLWALWLPHRALPLVANVIVGIGLAPLLWVAPGAPMPARVIGVLRVLALAQVYLLWHLAFAYLVPATRTAPPALMAWVGGCFTLLYLLQVWLLAHPVGALATRLYPWAYAGFYLDERFTRLVFQVWPVRRRVGATPRAGRSGQTT